jgi:membrane-bound lytic murein transglycosylase B
MNLKVVALVVPLLVLCACGGSAAKTVATSAAATKAPSTQPDQSATSAPAAAAGNPVNGADFCAFLTTMQPRMAKDGSAAGALADLAIEFASWLDTHPTQKPRTAADLDEASQSSCPAVRTAVLRVLGKDSFASALG